MSCKSKSNASLRVLGGENIFTTLGNFDVDSFDEKSATVVVAGKAEDEAFAAIGLPGCPKNGQTVEIVASGAPANVSAGETNTIALGKSYVDASHKASFTFAANADPCEPGVWIPDCCATIPPVEPVQ